MNKNFNQRFWSTEDKIQRALFSLLKFRKYDEIAIKELCYEAGINRSSFYAHYQDINDLMIKTEQRLSKNIVQIFNPNQIWTESVFVELFKFIFDNKDFYRAYLGTNEQTFMEKNDFINFVGIISKNNPHNKFSSNEMVCHMAFFAGGLKAMTKSWIQTGCKETPEQMAKILTNEYKIKSLFFE